MQSIRASRALPSLSGGHGLCDLPKHTNGCGNPIKLMLKSIPSSRQTFQRQFIKESPKTHRKSKSPKIILSMSLATFALLQLKLELILAMVRAQSRDN
jgi:hypothetical protein